MSDCLLAGLPADPLVDTEVWRYELTLGTPANGNNPAVPFDLSGSALAITFRTLAGFEVVSTLSTDTTRTDLHGTIAIADAAAGKISIVSDPWLRKYRVPVSRFSFTQTVLVRGDVMRLLPSDADSRPEYLGHIQFPLRAGTTSWPAPAS